MVVTVGFRHPSKDISSHAFPYRKQFGLYDADAQLPQQRAIIGNDVWGGCGATILNGVVVGDGAVIGAGAVVTKDVESYEIVAGVPAHHLGYRFEEDTRKKLQRSGWWGASGRGASCQHRTLLAEH